MIIPTYPAIAEAPAPMRNPTAVKMPNLSEIAPAPASTTKRTAATIPTVLYCRFM